jgi:hypothetical protein
LLPAGNPGRVAQLSLWLGDSGYPKEKRQSFDRRWKLAGSLRRQGRLAMTI